LILLAEALLLLSVSWVTELELVAANGTFNLLGGKAIILHFQEVNYVSLVWAHLDTEVNGTLADALFVFISASFNWWCWLVAWVGCAEALFVVAISGITVERVHITEQVTI